MGCGIWRKDRILEIVQLLLLIVLKKALWCLEDFIGTIAQWIKQVMTFLGI